MATTNEQRELDARVAERVMGWRIHFRNTAHYVMAHEQGTPYERPQAMHDWSPSRDIAAAFQVAERMRALGWCWQLMNFNRPAAIFEKGWPEPHSIMVEMDADTIQEAICHAALAAMEREAK